MNSGFRKTVLILSFAALMFSKASSAAPLTASASNSDSHNGGYSRYKPVGFSGKIGASQGGLIQGNGQGYVLRIDLVSHR